MEEEEYELLPLNPIRRVEKRVEKLERTGTSNEMIKELMDVVKTNQQVVDNIVKVNSDMINKVTELSASVSMLAGKINDFMGRIEVVGEGGEENEAAVAKTDDYSKRLEKLEKRINAMLISSMAKSRLRQPPKF